MQRASDAEDFKLSFITETFFSVSINSRAHIPRDNCFWNCYIKSNALIKCLFWSFVQQYNLKKGIALCSLLMYIHVPLFLEKDLETCSQEAVIIVCFLLWYLYCSANWVFSQLCEYIWSKLHCRKKILLVLVKSGNAWYFLRILKTFFIIFYQEKNLCLETWLILQARSSLKLAAPLHLVLSTVEQRRNIKFSLPVSQKMANVALSLSWALSLGLKSSNALK